MNRFETDSNVAEHASGLWLLLLVLGSGLVLMLVGRYTDQTKFVFSSISEGVFRVETFSACAAIFAAYAAWNSYLATGDETAYAHRPHFWIRFVELMDGGNEVLKEGNFIRLKLDIINNGQLSANVVGSDIRIFWTTSGLPSRYPYRNEAEPESDITDRFCPDNKVQCWIDPGGGAPGKIIRSRSALGREAADLKNPHGSSRLFLIGWVEFRTERAGYYGLYHFARIWSPDQGIFLPYRDNPDYDQDYNGGR